MICNIIVQGSVHEWERKREGVVRGATKQNNKINFAYFSNNAYAKSLQGGPTLRHPKDCSQSGSSVHGILQARVLEWGAIAFSECGAIRE